MENKDQEQWIEDILNSARGKTAVQPHPDLLGAIQHELDQEPPAAKVVQLSHQARNWLAVAAVLIGLLNALAFQQLLTGSSIPNDSPTSSLISDYNLYE